MPVDTQFGAVVGELEGVEHQAVGASPSPQDVPEDSENKMMFYPGGTNLATTAMVAAATHPPLGRHSLH